MEVNENQIQDFKLSDLKPIVGKTIKITLKKPIKTEGSNQEQYELIGIVNHIGLAANPPNLPVDLNITIYGTQITKNVNIFGMEKLEWK
jgi:hypothetical protein